MKKLLLGLLTSLTLLGALPVAAAETEKKISAASAIVLEPRTGMVLYEKDPDVRRLVASTTKIMTALVVLEHCALEEKVVATTAHAAVEGSSMYLSPGTAYTVEELLYGLLLASGNDAAAALADHCAGSMEAFAALMNEKAEELGLENTHFENAHGLDAPEHYSSARDLALITAEAMQNPVFARIFATERYSTHGKTYENHNRLLKTCAGCIGGKTGYTKAAGRILVSAVEREGMRLICVTVSDPDDWEDHAALYDTLFAAWRFIPLPQEHWSRIKTASDPPGFVPLVCGVPGLVLPRNAEYALDVRLPRFVFLPAEMGKAVGSVRVMAAGRTVYQGDIRFAATVREGSGGSPPAPPSLWERLRLLLLPPGVYYLQ